MHEINLKNFISIIKREIYKAGEFALQNQKGVGGRLPSAIFGFDRKSVDFLGCL